MREGASANTTARRGARRARAVQARDRSSPTLALRLNARARACLDLCGLCGLCLLLIIAWKDALRCRLRRGWTDLTIVLRTKAEMRTKPEGLLVAWRESLDSAVQKRMSGRFRISGGVRKTPVRS